MEIPNSDGRTALQDSAESKPPVTNGDAPAADSNPLALAKQNQVVERQFLRSLGFTVRGAKRLLAGGQSIKYLNTKIIAGVLLVDQVNSIEEIRLAQLRAVEFANNADFPPHVRASCLAVVAQLGQALSRLSEVGMSTARQLDEQRDGGESNIGKLTQINTSFFPPVATESRRPLNRPAKTGEAQITEISAEVK